MKDNSDLLPKRNEKKALDADLIKELSDFITKFKNNFEQ